ncbi:cysteine desulfurase NifS [uncultured Desulfuromonas sp.]|uniref:cysteine desulfurase NifS n=1 Tax=uncultured Desulfuromonas sp. TaxID=181013 RepID=UPI002AAAF503|nr:cysteine desulfurase NifS [uncultured Desulfuromonas sp.]
MKNVYLDNNATTPVLPEVVDALLPFYQHAYGNPSSIHWAGREVKGAVDSARQQVADLINATPQEIVFNGCGSEGDNQALIGSYETLKSNGNHIITTAVEHPAVLDTCRYLETKGARVTYLGVDSDGMLDLAELEAAITDQTILISVMWANNETGCLFPIGEIGRIARKHQIRFHCDAVQALGKVAIDVAECGVDLMVFSGHKIGAPKGVGALYIRDGIELESLIHGGHQEQGHRAGTLNVAGIVAFGKACAVAQQQFDDDVARMTMLRNRLQQGVLALPDVTLNGHRDNRLPNTLNVSFSFIEGEGLLLYMDMVGIAASSGSACTSGSDGPSHVLAAMGVAEAVLHSSVRFSLGPQTTQDDVDYVLEQLPPIVDKLREMSPMLEREFSSDCLVVECEIDPH